ncbi:MAG: aminotransferase class I/II-fold pyridoxal phosphate-dependent enzyme [Clostridia bacterium]|nr:aminotransferase class I/II-fold pyridoxal phosphate-dependent enzyme [Clostridia bacterium]
MNISNKMAQINSDIRGRNYFLSLDLEKQGYDILKLNTGNPASFGFEMPQSIKDALTENYTSALGYCDVRGMVSAREAIYLYHQKSGIKNFDLDNVFIGNGVSEIASMVCSSLLNPGDEVLLPTPCYSLWHNQVLLSSANPVFYSCDEENGWNPDIDHIKSLINEKTKAILIINPNNPTGVLYSDETLSAIADLARKHNLIVLSDEIYDRLVFDGKKFTTFASLAPDVTVITMNGLSKSHCLCGFRSGWAVISGDKKERTAISEAMLKIASIRLCAGALMQTVIPAALNDTQYTREMIAPTGRLFKQRKATWDALEKIPELSFVRNDAAFYVFPKIKKEALKYTCDKDFAFNLLTSKHILVVPGSGFSYENNDHFRIVMLPEAEILSAAVAKIGEFLQEK